VVNNTNETLSLTITITIGGVVQALPPQTVDVPITTRTTVVFAFAAFEPGP
jgi:hypothetical protein